MRRASHWSLINYPKSELVIERLTNCVITRSLFVVDVTGVRDECLFRNLPPFSRMKMRVVGMASAAKSWPQRLPPRDDYYLIFNLWSNGYHHWITEVSIKLLLFEQELRNGIILLPYNVPPFILEFFDLFDFQNTHRMTGNAFVKKLSVVTNPNSGHFHAAHLALLRKALWEKLDIADTKESISLYISRRNARARRVSNEDEVVEQLTLRGFTCLELDNVPFKDQVKLFSRADTIVSIHGAALTNMIFMRPGGRIIEFYPDIGDSFTKLNACYLRLADALGHGHSFLFSERDVVGRKPSVDVDNIRVDVDQLLRRLEYQSE